MIESKENAENKIYCVILAAILKNVILGTFPENFFVKLLPQFFNHNLNLFT